MSERVELQDMVCPYCNREGSSLLVTDSREQLLRFETSVGSVYLHLKCMGNIMKEWIEKHVRRTI